VSVSPSKVLVAGTSCPDVADLASLFHVNVADTGAGNAKVPDL
jgi:hypothetical protein